jgi:hypothetical protein
MHDMKLKCLGGILALLVLFGCEDKAAKGEALEQCVTECSKIWTKSLEACPPDGDARTTCVSKAQSLKVSCSKACVGKK